jgi:hypothetical protein
MSFQQSQISRPNRFRRRLVAFALMSSLSLALLPAGADSPRKPGTGPRSPTNSQQLSRILDRIDRTLAHWHRKSAAKADFPSEEQQLKTLRQNLDAQDRKAREEFAAIGRRLREKHLPAVILQRQRDAVARYKEGMATLVADFATIDKATSVSQRAKAVHKTREHLLATHKMRPRTPMDPAHLPTRSLKPNRNNKPRMSRKAFIRAGLMSNPGVRLAALGDFTYDNLPGASNPAYLAATPEVTLTPAIKAKAQELNYDPVQIYNWVHDNIEWVPSWGSLQSADLTLKSLRGNSIDTSGLLIALLRASGIPSRYVHGTIQITAEQLKDWAGGFSDADSAWDLVSSGGVPITAVRSGGKIIAFRMEQVWVEAAIDFFPSRGAVNKSADSWVALDTSFKKHFVVPGTDLTAAVPFNAQEYLSQVRDQNPVQWYMEALQSYLDTNQPDQTLGQAMGYQLIQPAGRSALPASLPYKVLLAASRYGSLPVNLHTRLGLQFASPNQLDPETKSFDLVTVAGKRFTLSYTPATSADQDLVNQYGGDMYSVPPYLLYLKPTVKLDGQVVYTGSAVQMGDAQSLTISYNGPGVQEQSYPHTLVAGGYYAIGLDVQGVNGFVLGDQNLQLNTTLARTDPENVDTDALIGTHLDALILQYFLTNDGFYTGASKIFDVGEVRAPSAGLAGFSLTVNYFFGIPRSATINKAQTDVGLEAVQATSKEGNATKLKTFLELRGLMGSYAEHGIWEHIENFHAVSAVKAIQLANAQGVPVYTIDQGNSSAILPQLTLDPDDLQEIQQGIQNGLVVTVPQHNITVDDWSGVGYIIKDPQTSVGVYRVSGGLSGASTTSATDGTKIIELFKGPFSSLHDSLDLRIRYFLVYSSEALAASGVISDEEMDQLFGYKIIDGVARWLGTSYEEAGRCTGFVIRAYYAAGIDLVALGKRHGLDPHLATQMYKLAVTLNIYGGVRTTDTPLLGDVVFFKHTYDKKKICSLADNDQPTHVGIVTYVNPGNPARIAFAAAGVVSGVTDGLRMARDAAGQGNLNSVLVSPRKCVPCDQRISFSDYPDLGTTKFAPDCPVGQCSNVSAPTCGPSDFPYLDDQGVTVAPLGKYAGQLFYGYATFRDPKLLLLK